MRIGRSLIDNDVLERPVISALYRVTGDLAPAAMHRCVEHKSPPSFRR